MFFQLTLLDFPWYYFSSYLNWSKCMRLSLFELLGTGKPISLTCFQVIVATETSIQYSSQVVTSLQSQLAKCMGKTVKQALW